MAIAAKKRNKKYKPGKRQSEYGALRLFFAVCESGHRQKMNAKELEIRQAAMGATLSFNSSWDKDSEFYPSRHESLMGLLKGNVDETCWVLVRWHFDWEAVLTVYYRDQDGEAYEKFLRLKFEMIPMYTPDGQPDEPGKMLGVEDLLEKVYLKQIRKSGNPNHTEESWGYFATITFFEDMNV